MASRAPSLVRSRSNIGPRGRSRNQGNPRRGPRVPPLDISNPENARNAQNPQNAPSGSRPRRQQSVRGAPSPSMPIPPSPPQLVRFAREAGRGYRIGGRGPHHPLVPAEMLHDMLQNMLPAPRHNMFAAGGEGDDEEEDISFLDDDEIEFMFP